MSIPVVSLPCQYSIPSLSINLLWPTLNMCGVASYHVLIFISLMTNDVEHLFSVTFSSIYPLWWSACWSLWLISQIGLFVFLTLHFLVSTGLLSDMWFGVFSPILWLSFHSLNSVFKGFKFWSSPVWPGCFFFESWLCCSVAPMSSLPNPRSQRVSPMFPSQSCIVLYLEIWSILA